MSSKREKKVKEREKKKKKKRSKRKKERVKQKERERREEKMLFLRYSSLISPSIGLCFKSSTIMPSNFRSISASSFVHFMSASWPSGGSVPIIWNSNTIIHLKNNKNLSSISTVDLFFLNNTFLYVISVIKKYQNEDLNIFNNKI